MTAERKTAKRTRPTTIDLFAGCGGLSWGLKKAGFTVLAAVEIDEVAAETYRANHKNALVFQQDIRAVDTGTFMKQLGIAAGELDLLTGCPPCQGFSRIRHNNGVYRMDDPRNMLIDEFGRFLKALLPKTFLIENVPDLAKYKRYASFISLARAHGYRVSVKVIDTADYGIPQRRKRLVVLGSRLGDLHHPSSSNKRVTVRDAIGDLPAPSRSQDILHSWPEHRSRHVQAIIRSIPKNGGSRTSMPKSRVLACHKRTDGFNDVYGRMSWDDVSPTITGGHINPSKGRFIHPEQDRAITLREGALLQSFPRNYIFSMTKGKYAAAEMIGNAIPPRFSYLQGRAILHHLRRLPEA